MCSFSDNLGWLFAFAFRSANSSSVFASWARTGSSFPATRSSIGVAGAASWVGDGNGPGLMAALDCLGSELGSGVGGVSMMSMGTVARSRGRSEEHTSELQSLMRISYAVFCLNKQMINIKNNLDIL